MSNIRHFMTLMDFSPIELNQLIERAIQMKQEWKSGIITQPFKQRTLAMIFEKSSTRTRVSFETGITQLGGHGLFLSPRDTQLGRGEPVEDSARVISSMATWVGDGNNMCQSWMNAARQFDFKLNIACPEGYDPDSKLLAELGGRAEIIRDIKKAVEGADLVSTDVWASMGQEDEQALRVAAFKHYQVNASVMNNAQEDALFMHCLPAHREEEVTAEVIDGPQSVVWDEAENRLHAQKALMETLAINSGLISQ